MPEKMGGLDIIGVIMDIHHAWYAIDWIHYNTHTFEWSSGVYQNHCLSIRGFVFGLQLFLSFDILVILCLACECITMVRCVTCIHDLCMTLTFHINMKVIFSPWIFSLLFDRGIPTFGLWVYHHETKCFVHSWLLTYMWVAGVSLVSITQSFYFVY